MYAAARRVLAGLGIAAAAIASTTAFAVPAQAATDGEAWVAWIDEDEKYVPVLVAGKGRANSVTITRSGRTITFDDKVTIRPGSGCKRVGRDKTKVKCTLSETPTQAYVWLEDKNDKFTNRADLWVFVDGGKGDDNIVGGKRDDVLRGGAGKDKLSGGAGPDVLIGGTGADVMKGGAGSDLVSYYERKKPVTADLDGKKRDDGERGERDTIATDVEELEGGKGADKLTGNGKPNFLIGGAGNDVLRGLGGNDALDGEAGADMMSGGAGADWVTYWGRKKAIRADADGGTRDDGQKGEKDTIGADVERLQGGEANDELTGNKQNNVLNGGPGDDRLHGGGGNDRLLGEAGADFTSGGDGEDYVSYYHHESSVTADLDGDRGDDGAGWGTEGDTIAADVEALEGGKAADTLTGDAGPNKLRGGPGDDLLNGGDGDDIIAGDAGSDEMNGGAGEDVVSYYWHTKPVTADLDGVSFDDGAKGERDTVALDVEGLEGGEGADKLTGNAGPNKLWGSAGNDVLNGGDGDDSIAGDAGADVMNGGAGVDVVSYLWHTKPVTADLDGAERDDGAKGEKDSIAADVEGLRGGSGADTLVGSAEANTIWGGAGNDVIRGGAGNDKLQGSNGDDSLYGEAGDDDLIGEPGTPPATTPDADDQPGSDAATDVVDGGDNTEAGDGCYVRAAGTAVNCERLLDLPAPAPTEEAVRRPAIGSSFGAGGFVVERRVAGRPAAEIGPGAAPSPTAALR